MSGCAFNKTWSVTPQRNWAERLTKQLGWKGKKWSEREALDFLECASAFEIVEASKVLLTQEEELGEAIIIPFGPIIEPYVNKSTLIDKDPILMAREAWSNDINIMISGTSYEGLLRAFINEEATAKILQQHPSFFAPLRELQLDKTDKTAIELGNRIKKVYYGDLEPSVENPEPYLRVS